MREKIGNVTINLDYYNGIDNYSDGEEIENELLEIVKTEKDLEKVVGASAKWPIIYHLSKKSNVR